MDYSQMIRLAGGAMGGLGQGMMDQNMQRTYSASRGGFQDLMENQKIAQFIRTGRSTVSDPRDEIQKGVQDAQLVRKQMLGSGGM